MTPQAIARPNYQSTRNQQQPSTLPTHLHSNIPDVRHVSFQILNTRIFFPYEPYEPQRLYSEKVIEALSKGYNAILESPTGTGKTLSLLCSALAWVQTQTEIKSNIYYTSRTHLQLDQAAKEMKKTAYARNCGVVLASRSNMCLNDEVRNSHPDQINRSCRNAIAKNACSYFSNYEQKLETVDHQQVFDIEDLVGLGRIKQLCPYYASKKIAETKANIVFMPYNYLLDPSLSRNSQFKIENSIIIFDEAHNIENSLKEAVSGSFTQTCLKVIRESCLKLPSKVSEALSQEKFGISRSGYDPKSRKVVSTIVDELRTGRKESGASKKDSEKEPKVNPIEELAEKLTLENLQKINRCAEILLNEVSNHMVVGNTTTVDKVLCILKEADVKYHTSNSFISTLESMASFWSIAGVMDAALVAKHVAAITNFSNFLNLLFPESILSWQRQEEHDKLLSEYYVAHFEAEHAESNVLRHSSSMKDWKLNLWCLHPAIGMKRVIDLNCINGPRSIIITSGTLAPMQSIETDLEVKFNIIREFKHIIGPENLKIMVLGQSPSGYSLRANHEAIKKDEYSIALGKTLSPMLKILPFGTLIFFSSYSSMNRVLKYWKEKSTIWREMNSITQIYVESHDSFDRDLIDFRRRIENAKRAVYLGVCRGKLSEGVNLSGNQCRTLILTGLPYPSLYDPKIRATREFHSKRGDSKGNKWYTQQMTRALNQTIGRVIRDKKDFGLLLLCDPAFTQCKYNLSEWTYKFFPKEQTKMNEVHESIKNFFNQHGIAIQESISENLGAFEMEISPFGPPSANSRSSGANPSTQNQIKNTQNQGTNVEHSDNVQSVSKTRQSVQSLMRGRMEQIFNQMSKSPGHSVELSPSNIDQTCDQQPQPPTRRIMAPRGPSPKRKRNLLSSQSTTDRSQSSSNKEYSIVKESRAKDLPSLYKCEFCGENPARKPHRTSCTCARVGCRRCLKFLAQEACKKCGKVWRFVDFKPLYFKSAFLAKQRSR